MWWKGHCREQARIHRDGESIRKDSKDSLVFRSVLGRCPTTKLHACLPTVAALERLCC